MIQLGETDPILQRIADEMAARNAPAPIAEMTPAEVRAELDARGLVDDEAPFLPTNKERKEKSNES